MQKLQGDVTKATQDSSDVKAENAGLHEQLQERTKEEQEAKKVRMELRDTNTAQKVEIEKLRYERDDNKKRLDDLNTVIERVNAAAEEVKKGSEIMRGEREEAMREVERLRERVQKMEEEANATREKGEAQSTQPEGGAEVEQEELKKQLCDVTAELKECKEILRSERESATNLQNALQKQLEDGQKEAEKMQQLLRDHEEAHEKLTTRCNEQAHSIQDLKAQRRKILIETTQLAQSRRELLEDYDDVTMPAPALTTPQALHLSPSEYVDVLTSRGRMEAARETAEASGELYRGVISDAHTLLTAANRPASVTTSTATSPGVSTTHRRVRHSNMPATFRSVSEIEAYLHDDEVQANIDELLQRITDDETLTDIDEMINEQS